MLRSNCTPSFRFDISLKSVYGFTLLMDTGKPPTVFCGLAKAQVPGLNQNLLAFVFGSRLAIPMLSNFNAGKLRLGAPFEIEMPMLPLRIKEIDAPRLSFFTSKALFGFNWM